MAGLAGAPPGMWFADHMVQQFRYLPDADRIRIGENEIAVGDTGDFLTPEEWVRDGSWESLHAAFTEADLAYRGLTTVSDEFDFDLPQVTMHLSQIPAANFSSDSAMAGPTHFGLMTGGLVTDTELVVEDLSPDQIRKLMAPIVEAANAELVQILPWENDGLQLATVRTALQGDERTVGEAIDLSDDLQALVEQVTSNELNARSASALARIGKARTLIGQPESIWLEVKSRGWDLSDERARIELARDVIRFANGDCDSLILVGLTTSRRDGNEVISGARLSPTPFDIARHHKTIDDRAFPIVHGLTIEDISTDFYGQRGHLMAIFVPRQSEPLKPYMVRGTGIDGRIEDVFFTVPVRRGEQSINVSIQELHGWMAAGRSALRPHSSGRQGVAES